MGAGKKTAPTLVKSAAGFGPETPLARLSPAISLILSGVPQNEVSFGKKAVVDGKRQQGRVPGVRGKDESAGRGEGVAIS